MSKRSLWAICGVGLVVLVAWSVLFRVPAERVGSAPPGPGPQAPRGSPPSTPRWQAKSAVVDGKEGSRTTWTVRARSIRLDDKKNQLHAEKVECTFFDESRKPEATAWCDSATMDTSTRDVQFHGPVRVKSVKGETLAVKRLRYDGKQRMFFGRDGVCVTRSTSVMTGDRVASSTDLMAVTVTGNVHVQVRSLATNP